MRKIKEDFLFDTVNVFILSVITIIVLYPLYFVVIASISNPDAVNSGKVILLPKGFTLQGYIKMVEDSRIWIGYRNTIFYTFTGTFINVIVTLTAAYSLSRKDLAGYKFIMGYFIITMYFGGGLIPLYIIVNKMGLYNSPLVLIILGMVSVYNLIITRTFYQNTIPGELLEAAFIDGCGNFYFFVKIVLPTSKAITAVLVIYYGVSHWNQFFNALIFLSKPKLYPLQLILREILIQNQSIEQNFEDMAGSMVHERERYAELIKYGVVIASSLPMLVLYPFAQKYFTKGVMIGSVKG